MDTQELSQALPFHNVDVGLTIHYDRTASQALGKDYWRVVHAFKFYVGAKEDNLWVVVPAGFLTDGATVPRPFWSLIPPWGAYGQAAVVHDWLCEQGMLYHNGELVDISRSRGDAIFKEAMKVAGVGYWTRSVMYWAVRAFAKFKRKPDAARRALKARLEQSQDSICVHCEHA